MQRPSTAFLLIILGLSGLVLATAIMLQAMLYRHDRLHLLEQVNGGLARESAELIQKQIDSGVSLRTASRVLARVAHLDNRSGLISMLAVTGPDGERVFYFDDHPQGSYPTPSLQPASIERDWRPVALSSNPGALVRTYADNSMLYVAAPVAASVTTGEPAARAMVIIGLDNPAPLQTFLLGSHSPLVVAAWMMYLAAAVGLFAAHRIGRRAAERGSASAASLMSDELAPIDAAIIRAEQALEQLNRMAR